MSLLYDSLAPRAMESPGVELDLRVGRVGDGSRPQGRGSNAGDLRVVRSDVIASGRIVPAASGQQLSPSHTLRSTDVRAGRVSYVASSGPGQAYGLPVTRNGFGRATYGLNTRERHVAAQRAVACASVLRAPPSS